MPFQGTWAGVDALPCCAAAAKAEEAAAVVSDDVTTARPCSDFTAVSKLPLVHCLVAASKNDTGSATGRKFQPSGGSMTAHPETECTARVFAPARPSAFAAGLASLPL